MTKRNRKKNIKRQDAFSPVSYLMKGKARKLAIHQCMLPANWQVIMKFPIIVSRKHINGNITFASFMVDLLCTGVKDVMYAVNLPEFELIGLIDNFLHNDIEMEECDYDLVHNIIYESLAYAEEFGIPPHHDFEIAEMILEEDTEDIPFIDIPLGQNGRPVLIMNPDDPKNSMYKRLMDKNVGPGNYDILDNDFFDFDEESDLDDEFDDDPNDWDEEDWMSFLDWDMEEYLPYDEAFEVFYERVLYNPTMAGKQLAATDHLKKLDFEISFDPLEEPWITPDRSKKNETYFYKINDPELTKAGHKKLLKEIDQDLKLDPENQILYGYKANVLDLLGKEREVEKLQKEILDKFPYYIFGKINYGLTLLKNGHLDAIPKLFDGEFALPLAFPHRKGFHISEFIGFQVLMGLYHLRKDNLEQAFTYYKPLVEIDLQPETPMPIRFQHEIKLAIYNKVVPVMNEAKKDPSKMKEYFSLLVN